MFSKFLASRKEALKCLVKELSKTYKYVSILGTDVKGIRAQATKQNQTVSDDGYNECGFVVKMTNDDIFFEYSLDDINGDIKELALKIVLESKISKSLESKHIKRYAIDEEKLEKDFVRESDLSNYQAKDLLVSASNIKDELINKCPSCLTAGCILMTTDVSKIFVSKNKCLTQNYTWVNGIIILMVNENGKQVQVREGAYSINVKEVLDKLPTLMDKLVSKAHKLTLAKPIVPGFYDVITDASITGLIAHEAFGHGVEMDQFVKDRAYAKHCMGEYVASTILNMKDGAKSDLSVASYFFDDDGILAGDTDIIVDGKLKSGICDMQSALQLGCKPTGNGRRQSFSHKTYTRMTNTFFLKGNSTLDEMIKSIKHGFYLAETNNGMEDPKNWNIQCTAEYAIEIIDGKLTDNYFSPAVMSGYVPDLLKSITMISNDYEIEGSGYCGKGYKEWVKVSSGGANVKCKVKLS